MKREVTMTRITGTAVIGSFALVALLLVASCEQSNTNLGMPPQDHAADLQTQDLGLTLDDVFGDHNPKMIGGWGGENTREEWFLRCVWSPHRIDMLENGLRYFYALHGRFPFDWNELEDSGMFPIRPLDPIDGGSINYGIAPTSTDDFHNMLVEPSAAGWFATGMTPLFPDGNWIEAEWEMINYGEFFSDVMHQRAERYPNAVAMAGASLADALERVLHDRISRRNLMPESSEELLDGLWIVHHEWAVHDPGIDLMQPGTFVFGIDETQLLAVAAWRDDLGVWYTRAWRWDPWPEGWDRPPQPYGEVGLDGIPWHGPHEGYVPETMLWSCSLPGAE